MFISKFSNWMQRYEINKNYYLRIKNNFVSLPQITDNYENKYIISYDSSPDACSMWHKTGST